MKSIHRFHVLTHGLSPDLKRVHPAFGKINRGDVSRYQLGKVLELYRDLETEWAPSHSHFAIQSDFGRCIVRAANKQLTFIDETTTPAPPPIAATVEEIIARLERPPDLSVAPTRPPPEPVWRVVATLTLICLGVGLMVYALQPLVAPSRPVVTTDLVFVTDAQELKTRQDAINGIFATGQKAGDRHLTISAQGHVVFAELGARQSLGAGADSYRIARRDKRTCLLTTRSGVIEAINSDTLLYYGDLYRRVN